MQARFPWLALAAILCGCGGRAVTLPAPPALDPVAEGVVVSLTWNAPVDLDLYVTDPTWETLYFANNPTRAGGRLERDVRCDALRAGRPGLSGGAHAARLERASIVAVRPGPYRIGVDFIDDCGNGDGEVSFHVAADVDGVRRESTGKVALQEFRIIALAFELDEEGRLAWADERRR